MIIATPSQLAPTELPARRVDGAGVAHVDLRAVLALALPLVANSAVQTILNLTDLWFIGHISTTALAAVGSVNWLVIAVVLLLAGPGMAVQTTAAQAFGAGRRARAAQATWSGLWGIALVAPLFIAVALSSHYILAPFGIVAGHRGHRHAVLVAARCGRPARGRGVGCARILQRHRPAAHHGGHHRHHHLPQRCAEPAVHLRSGARGRWLRLGVDLCAGRGAGEHPRHLPFAALPARVPLAPDVAAALVGALGAVPAGISDGTDRRLGPDRYFTVPADAGARGRRGRGGDAAGVRLDRHRLHAGPGRGAGRHHPGRTVDRGRQPRLGDARGDAM